jgi:hypothetical protein
MQTLQANESSSLELVLIISFSAGKQRDALHHSQIFDSLEIFFLSCINHVLSRTQADKIDHIYSLMESFKNGRIFSPKYESISKTFKPCHVVVFANFIPDHSKLSQDRWLVKNLYPCPREHGAHIRKSSSSVSIDSMKRAKRLPLSVAYRESLTGVLIPSLARLS